MAVKKTKAKKGLHPLAYEIIGLLLIGLAIIVFFEYGVVGRTIQTVSMFLFGNLHIVVPFFAVLIAVLLMINREGIGFTDRIVQGCILIVCSLAIFSHSVLFEELFKSNKLLSDSVIRETWRLLIDSEGIQTRSSAMGGGMVGALLFSMFHILFDSAGAKIAAWFLFSIGLILITGKALVPVLVENMPKWKKKFPRKKRRAKPIVKDEKKQRRSRTKDEPVSDEIAATAPEAARGRKRKAKPEPVVEAVYEDEEDFDEEPIISAFTQHIQHKQPAPAAQITIVEEEPVVEDKTNIDEVIQKAVETNVENVDYRLPSMNLLLLPPAYDQSGEYSVIQANAKKLESTLLSFGVKAKVTQVHLGPAVTKYEVMPDVGVKVSKIVSLQDDLALALAAKDIRMEAPIPGKSAIGIEVPNSEIAMVTLREVLEAKENNKPDSKLLIGFGRDITGQAILAELNKMPHLLVAGSTGSGKSVCINGIIVSILMRAAPHEVKMMLIDPKMVELNVYNGIPHLLAPVVTDA
ncbi:MAG TPA: DNA translocase FtsK, partial [Ureibacillus sp.]|nr:DNA translocase FtsK [Ureibacillus sp.]